MKATKRIISVLLTVVMLLGIATVAPTLVNAASTFEALKNKYPHRTTWNSTYQIGRAVGCHGFAMQLGLELSDIDPYTWSYYEDTYSYLKLGKLKAGDIIRTYNEGHTIMVTNVNGNTFNYVDCNWLGGEGNNIVNWNGYCTITNGNYLSTFGTANYILSAPKDLSNANIHNPVGSWDVLSEGGIGRIRVTGWAYDIDDVNASLDIHVYVGGPAGSGAPCYVIKADKYRTDINIGNCLHGFDSYIEVYPRGNQIVYLYAINVGLGNYTKLGGKSITITDEVDSFGYDFPTNNQEISDRNFLFQGWVKSNKEVESITCSINDGEKYITSNLYYREDVPNATAFRAEIATSNLKFGSNKVSLCVNFTDGTGKTLDVRNVNRTRLEIISALDYPQEEFHIDSDKFLCQGWIEADKEINSIAIRVNNGEYYSMNLYEREDVPYATAFRIELPSGILFYGQNDIVLCVKYEDGTEAVPIIRRIYKDYTIVLDNPIENDIVTSEMFLFQGWATSNEKEIKSIKCKINEKQLIEANLYTRDDVPFATAFRGEIDKHFLSFGQNKISVVVEYTDGSQNITEDKNIYLSAELGDVNLDGTVSIFDVAEIQRHIAQLITLDEAQLAVADTNGDGEVNIIDATQIQKYIALLIDKLG